MNIESYKKCPSAISLQGREKSVRKSSIRAANISKKKQGKNQNDYLVRQEERRLRKSRNRLTYYDDQTYMDYLPVRYPSVRSRHNDGGGWS